MGLIQWKKEYSIDIPQLDKQHKRIITIVNKLLVQQVERGGAEKIGEILDELQEYIGKHFKAEEAYILDEGLPGYAEQREQHNQFIHRFFEVRKEFAMNGRVTSVNLFNFVWDWFSQHMLKLDKQLSRRG